MISPRTRQDLHQLASECVNLAKENLIKDGYLVPAVAIIKDIDHVQWISPHFENADDKRGIFQHISNLARRRNAEAVLVIQDVWMKSEVASTDISKYRQGDLAKDPAHEEAIFVGLKVRGDVSSHAWVSKYTRRDGQLVFSPVTHSDGADFGLLPNWYDISKGRVH